MERYEVTSMASSCNPGFRSLYTPDYSTHLRKIAGNMELISFCVFVSTVAFVAHIIRHW